MLNEAMFPENSTPRYPFSKSQHGTQNKAHPHLLFHAAGHSSGKGKRPRKIEIVEGVVRAVRLLERKSPDSGVLLAWRCCHASQSACQRFTAEAVTDCRRISLESLCECAAGTSRAGLHPSPGGYPIPRPDHEPEKLRGANGVAAAGMRAHLPSDPKRPDALPTGFLEPDTRGSCRNVA